MSNYPPGVSDNDFDLPSVGEDDGPLSPEEQDEDALAKLAESKPSTDNGIKSVSVEKPESKITISL